MFVRENIRNLLGNGLRGLLGRYFMSPAPSVLSRAVGHPISRYRHEPGQKRSGRIIRATGRMQREKCFLHEIFDVLGLQEPKALSRRSLHHGYKGAQQVRVCAAVARLRGTHQVSKALFPFRHRRPSVCSPMDCEETPQPPKSAALKSGPGQEARPQWRGKWLELFKESAVIACGLVLMPLLVDVDQQHIAKAAPSVQQSTIAEFAPRR